MCEEAMQYWRKFKTYIHESQFWNPLPKVILKGDEKCLALSRTHEIQCPGCCNHTPCVCDEPLKDKLAFCKNCWYGSNWIYACANDDCSNTDNVARENERLVFMDDFAMSFQLRKTQHTYHTPTLKAQCHVCTAETHHQETQMQQQDEKAKLEALYINVAKWAKYDITWDR